MDAQELLKDRERRLKQEAREEGEKTGAGKILLRLYGVRFGAVPEHVRTRIEAESDLVVLAA